MISLYIFQNYEFEKNKSSLTELQKSNLPIVGEISRISLLMTKNQNQLQHLIDSAKQQNDSNFNASKKEVIAKVVEIQDSFEKLMHQEFEHPMRPIIKEVFSIYVSHTLDSIELTSNDLSLAQQKFNKTSEALGEVNHLLIGLSNHFITQLTLNSVLLEKSLYSTWMPIFILFTIGLTILAGLFISHRMSFDLHKFTSALKDLSFGNNAIETPKTNDPYFLDLAKSVESFKTVLQKYEQQQAFLEESNNRYETLLNLIPTAIVALNHEHEIVLFNKAAEHVFKFESSEILYEPLSVLLPDITSDATYKNEHELVKTIEQSETDMSRRPFEATRKSGERFLVEISLAKMQVLNEDLTTLAITDVTARHEAEEKIWHQAHYDALTGLPNRLFAINSLDNTLRLAKRNKQKVAVLFIDLDDFKKINDTLGHATGDDLLIEASKRLKSQVRESDIVGRLGGDEFVVILTELTRKESIERILEQLVKLFREPIQINGKGLITTLSVGVAMYPDDATDIHGLLRKADVAMYHAKKKGRNGYALYQGDMHHSALRRIEIEEQLNNAIANQELEVYYQCQHDALSQNVIGTEALIRWNNEKLGSISPYEFIPIAEQTGQIIEIGEFVLREAVSKLKEWHQAFPDNKLKLSVNLSPVQFRDPLLLEKVDSILHEQDIEARYLNLEITEGTLMSGRLAAEQLLKNLKQKGVSISIDDFGTGYSSLGYLQNFSFDTLKIDRTFVKNCTTSQPDQQLIKAIIAMAHALNLKVIVEGVETQDQYDFIIDVNGDAVQGYFFCKPVPANKINDLLSQDNEAIQNGS